MNTSLQRRYKPLALIAAAIALMLYAAPPPQAQAQAASPDWYAWNFKVDFPGVTPRILMTVYEGMNGDPIAGTPVTVTASSQTDISAKCLVIGSLPISAGAATFNGSSYIRCTVPVAEFNAMDELCSGSAAPFFWGAVQATLAPGSLSNPIFTLGNTQTHSFAGMFSLPRNGANARSRLTLPGGTYTSAPWALNNGENRALMGSDGPSIIEIADYHASSGWLGFMTSPDWQNAFAGVSATKVGSWAEPAMASWQTGKNPVPWRNSDTLDIGYNGSNGTYFAGTMSNGEFDPPGCSAK